MAMKKPPWRERLRHARKRVRGINWKIRKRRRKGQKTPELADLRRHVRKKIAWLEAHPPPPATVSGLVMFDNHQCAAWIVREVLEPARKSGVWDGSVISGYRSDAYQCEVCKGVCGNCDGCPGTCAPPGTSNHRGINKPDGAVDVSDAPGLQRWCRAHGTPLRGNAEQLPADTPHFSTSGR